MNVLGQTGESQILVIEEVCSTVAVLRGDVGSELRVQAGEALAAALDRGLPLILDATEVRSIDSIGVAFLIQCCTIGREEGLCVMLRNPPSVVSDVLALLGLDHIFDESSVPTVAVPENASLYCPTDQALSPRPLAGEPLIAC